MPFNNEPQRSAHRSFSAPIANMRGSDQVEQRSATRYGRRYEADAQHQHTCGRCQGWSENQRVFCYRSLFFDALQGFMKKNTMPDSVAVNVPSHLYAMPEGPTKMQGLSNFIYQHRAKISDQKWRELVDLVGRWM